LNKDNFDIKLKEHFKLYVLFKDKITFESELSKNDIRYYSDINEQPMIDSGIRYFLLDSDADKINKIVAENQIIANTESQLVFDYLDEKRRMKIYVSVAVVVIGILLLIMIIEKIIS